MLNQLYFSKTLKISLHTNQIHFANVVDTEKDFWTSNLHQIDCQAQS